VAPFDFFPANAPPGFVGFGPSREPSLYGSRPPTSPEGLHRNEDGNILKKPQGLIPIPPGLGGSSGNRPMPVALTSNQMSSQMGSPYLESHTLLTKRNRSLEIAVKRMGAELTQWREEGAVIHEAHAKELSKLEAKYQRQLERYEEKLRGAAEEKKQALEAQRAELVGRAGASEYAKKQREKQIEHLTQMAARRMGKQKLSMGWGAWLNGHREKQRRKRMLQASASRILRPKLMHGYRLWRYDWSEAQEAKRVAAAVAEGQRAGQQAVTATQEAMRKQAEEK